MQHAGEQVGGILRAHNDGGRTDAQGEEEGKSDVWEMWKGDGGGVTSHCMTQHGKARERKWAWTDAAMGGGEGEEQQTYRMEFPKGGTTECLKPDRKSVV